MSIKSVVSMVLQISSGKAIYSGAFSCLVIKVYFSFYTKFTPNDKNKKRNAEISTFLVVSRRGVEPLLPP